MILSHCRMAERPGAQMTRYNIWLDIYIRSSELRTKQSSPRFALFGALDETSTWYSINGVRREAAPLH